MLPVSGGEFEGWVIDQTCQVVRQIFEYHEAFILLDHDFLQCDDMLVSEMLQQSDLTNRRDREPVAFALHANLLERNLVFRVNVDGLKDLSICSGTDHRFIARFAIVYRIRSCHLGRKRRPRLGGLLGFRWWSPRSIVSTIASIVLVSFVLMPSLVLVIVFTIVSSVFPSVISPLVFPVIPFVIATIVSPPVIFNSQFFGRPEVVLWIMAFGLGFWMWMSGFSIISLTPRSVFHPGIEIWGSFS